MRTLEQNMKMLPMRTAAGLKWIRGGHVGPLETWWAGVTRSVTRNVNRGGDNYVASNHDMRRKWPVRSVEAKTFGCAVRKLLRAEARARRML